MNLFATLFDSISRYERTAFLAQADDRMCIDYLGRALSKPVYDTPSLRKLSKANEVLASADLRSVLRREPELYFPILNLAMRDLEGEELEKHLHLLGVHTNLLDFRTPFEGIRFVRKLIRPEIYDLINDRYFSLKDLVYQPTNCQIKFLAPTSGLFSDMLPSYLYPIQFAHTDVAFGDIAQRTVDLIRKYSPELALDIELTIKAVCFTPNIGRPGFSYRIAYFGGVFINPFVRHRFSVAETLIHEYLHQRLWQWWAFERMIDPEDDITCITSPITGQTRTAAVMLQALIIYIQTIHFLDYLLAEVPLSADTSAAEARRASLRKGLPILTASLSDTLAQGTEAQRCLTFLKDNFVAVQSAVQRVG
jgi:hypothetical protein